MIFSNKFGFILETSLSLYNKYLTKFSGQFSKIKQNNLVFQN